MKTPWTLGLLILLLAPRSGEAGEKVGVLQGTFLQMWSSHQALDEEGWERLFGCFGKLRLRELVVQFTKVNELSLLEPAKEDPHRPAPILTVLRLARKYRLKVWIGLYSDLKFFEGIQKGPAELETYLGQLRVSSLSLARQLAPRLSTNPQFAGWYVSEEIHDESFSDPERKDRLFAHLAALGDELLSLTPGKRIALSGFSNGTLSPEGVETFWRELLASTRIGTVFFQDGVGAHKLSLEKLPDILQAVRKATAGQKRELRVVVETFRQLQGSPERFEASPAPWDELRKQLIIARAIAAPGITAFSVPEYMCPDRGELARGLFDAYRRGLGLVKAKRR